MELERCCSSRTRRATTLKVVAISVYTQNPTDRPKYSKQSTAKAYHLRKQKIKTTQYQRNASLLTLRYSSAPDPSIKKSSRGYSSSAVYQAVYLLLLESHCLPSSSALSRQPRYHSLHGTCHSFSRRHVPSAVLSSLRVRARVSMLCRVLRVVPVPLVWPAAGLCCPMTEVHQWSEATVPSCRVILKDLH